MKEVNKLKTSKNRSLKNQGKMKIISITITKVKRTGKRVRVKVKVMVARTNTMRNLERKKKMIELNIDYHEACSRI